MGILGYIKRLCESKSIGNVETMWPEEPIGYTLEFFRALVKCRHPLYKDIELFHTECSDPLGNQMVGYIFWHPAEASYTVEWNILGDGIHSQDFTTLYAASKFFYELFPSIQK